MKKRKPADIIIIVILSFYGVMVLLPIIWVLMTSLKTNQEFFADPWGIFASPQFENYVYAWKKVEFGKYTFNSVFITVSVVLLSSVLAMTASYVLVRFKFRSASPLLLFFISGLYIPVVLILPSEFLLLNKMHLIDSHIGLIIAYTALSLPYSILMMSGFFRSVPKEVEEAAYLDGCSYNRTFWSIVVPMSKNGIATMAVFNLLWVWNDFMVSMTVIIDKSRKTLPVGIIDLMSSFKLRADWVTLFAGLVLVMLPTIVLYALFQKKLEAGLMLGSTKG